MNDDGDFFALLRSPAFMVAAGSFSNLFFLWNLGLTFSLRYISLELVEGYSKPEEWMRTRTLSRTRSLL